MAGPLMCDTPGCEARADFMMTLVKDGTVVTFCHEHFVAMCLGLAMDEAAAQAAQQDAPVAGDGGVDGEPEGQTWEPTPPAAVPDDSAEAARKARSKRKTADPDEGPPEAAVAAESARGAS